MPALASDLRKTLEATVVKARDKAEGGARDALTALAVDASEPFSSMSEEERKLRNRLRARGRQLGDQRDPQKGSQSIERLVREMAYEHWHRMLFARFLAENQLLIEPTSGVAISLDECEELAAEEGTDLSGLAAQYAQSMLPQIFRGDDPVLAAKLPLEIRQQLQGLVAGLETETFTASDSLGWTYQFWQTKRKKEVNDSGVKIGADELSPVTQLFTEDYMVDFLLDNTLGAWHAGKVLAANPQLTSTAQTEDDLRQAVALTGCPWSYLRFIKTDDGAWKPAAGTFEGWPRTSAELKCLDPCMGSGHFVVAMFERLVALRIEEEGLTEKAAVEAVIEGNLFGLEIDPRCTQIAAFNLALAAWRRLGHCKLPAMGLACSGLAPNATEADWLALAGDSERLRNGMGRLYRLFDKAAVLGSLINPRAEEADLLVAGFNELQPLLEQALVQETKDDTAHEMAVTARGVAKAAEILAGQFTLVATNVPYLGRGNQDEGLRVYCGRVHPEAKADLATCFVERSTKFCGTGGSAALVTPQNWLFLSRYSDLRIKLLKSLRWDFVARLGPRAFETIGGEVVSVALIQISRDSIASKSKICGLDIESAASPKEKAEGLGASELESRPLSDICAQVDAIITFSDRKSDFLLRDFADTWQGMVTCDDNKFLVRFWEVLPGQDTWNLLQLPPQQILPFTGKSTLIRWDDGRGALHTDSTAHNFPPKEALSRPAIAMQRTGELNATLMHGEIFGDAVAPIFPRREDHLPAIWAFAESGELARLVRILDKQIKAAVGSFIKVPFDLSHWQKVAADKYPDGLPKPFSSDSTQWLFSGLPAGADQPLHVAAARLVGYQWPRQTGTRFTGCPALDPDGLEALADDDGIVCLSPIRGEAAAGDRLRGLLAAVFCDEWSTAKERELLLETAVANDARKAAADLGDWLRQSFFTEHCKLFQSRPFIWQIWDGNPNGFSALVNCHKLAAPNGQGRKTLELLTYTYLGDWIDRQKLDQAEGVNGADDRHAAALDLQGQLKKILDGEPPYDIFVRWKPLHQQAIGWDPDINDGVRMNIRPFLSAQLRKGGKTGAGILRAKPGTIKWAKDRGKEPSRSKDDFPWFWGWDENSPAMATDFGAPVPGAPPAGDSFDGNRWNDLHYSRAAKEEARARHRGEG
ncbi:BREX-1 system adenine-specific DNA-methyltransferase PglX [Synechococcus sp. EJ6-Ellesmere]|uniref:BREX-1 system adenine-specific DNA-methyltransferase PglX n=1 Tax=Synechococcus sp. EJ6-Ellesmere TaxID=2823734 RepID=UPI0020CF891A|nr:BREX-1 system adenine-specific DNA-methyltransferase PglX [Synechococcus sp. EJ6-Ellesmere]MCP9825135.1 SAM-dependent DNA methyltransferase [Synechococcus sp. EJ6-Ellesmere]